MSFFRRLLGRLSGPRFDPDAPPTDLLDYLQERRIAAEAKLLRKHKQCPECGSGDLRVGTWSRGGQAGWTVICANCGYLLEQTTEIRSQ